MPLSPLPDPNDLDLLVDMAAYVVARMEDEQIEKHEWLIPEGYLCPSAHVCTWWVQTAMLDYIKERTGVEY